MMFAIKRRFLVRAIVFVPISFPGPIFDDADFDLDDSYELGSVSKLRLRDEFREVLCLQKGPLEYASQSEIPCAPFNRSLGRDLNNVLRSKFEVANYSGDLLDKWNSRASSAYLSTPIATSLTGVKLEAVETFTLELAGSGESFIYLFAFHLVANEKTVNIDSIISLTKLDNAPIKSFLNHFYHTNFELKVAKDGSGKLPNLYDQKNSKDAVKVDWSLSPGVSSTFCVFGVEKTDHTSCIENGNLILQLGSDDREITRFATRATFLGALINSLKIEFDALENFWLGNTTPSYEQISTMKDRLVRFRSNWWWPHISYDDAVQIPYSQWISKLSFEARLSSFERDINEWWTAYIAKRTAEESEELTRLNNLLKVIAIFSLIPAWLSLFATTFPWWFALPFAVLAGATLWFTPSRRLKRLVARLENRLR